jgi:F-type H+-transporting ATPase subunit delta
MPRSSSARRYAEAAFALASRDGTVDAWQQDLSVAAGLGRNSLVAHLMDSPVVAFTEKREAAAELLGKRVSPLVVNLVLLLAKDGRFAILPAVSAEYDALVRRSRGIVAATVTTPTPLAKEQLAAVHNRVEQLAGAKVELAAQTDPALLGGLTVQIGDRLIDASLRGRLERLRTRLVQGTS